MRGRPVLRTFACRSAVALSNTCGTQDRVNGWAGRRSKARGETHATAEVPVDAGGRRKRPGTRVRGLWRAAGKAREHLKLVQ